MPVIGPDRFLLPSIMLAKSGHDTHLLFSTLFEGTIGESGANID
jgi:hypothetical protein